MGPPDPFNRGTPRGSLYGFISAANKGDYDRAARYLDLRNLGPEDQTSAAETARKLKVVLNRRLWVDFSALSDRSEGAADDGLEAWYDHVADLRTKSGQVPFLLRRVPRADGVKIWKVAASTVAETEGLYEELGPSWIEGRLPPVFFSFNLFGLALWQWLFLPIVGFLSWLLAVLISAAVVRVIGKLMTKGDRGLDPHVARVAPGPIRLAIAVIIFQVASGRLLALNVPTQEAVGVFERLLLVVAAAWLLFRVIDLIGARVRTAAEAQHNEALLTVLQPISIVGKMIVGVMAVLGILGSFGVDVTAAIAGLGIGGIAVALAAQKTVENLFGAVTLFADRPVLVGDYIRGGTHEGTVEEIGLRSTRIRTLDRTVIAIPNGEFSNLALENFAHCDRRRVSTTIGVRYETSPEQLRFLLAKLREILIAHPRVLDEAMRVRFVGFGPYALDLEIQAYVDTGELAEFLGVREDLYLRFMDAVEQSGTGFAFPSSTLYVGTDEGLDSEVSRRAEEEVSRWRDAGQLPFPDSSDDAVGGLRNTLDWPPTGSSTSRR